jgi:hypothetical protein
MCFFYASNTLHPVQTWKSRMPYTGINEEISVFSTLQEELAPQKYFMPNIL